MYDIYQNIHGIWICYKKYMDVEGQLYMINHISGIF